MLVLLLSHSKGEEIKLETEQRQRLSKLSKISNQNLNLDILTLKPVIWPFPFHHDEHMSHRAKTIGREDHVVGNHDPKRTFSPFK